MKTDRELLEMAAKAASIVGRFIERMPEDGYPCYTCGIGGANSFILWNPLTDDGDALRLAVKLKLNIMFSGGFHHVGADRFVLDICRSGDISELRWGIVYSSAEIGKAMP